MIQKRIDFLIEVFKSLVLFIMTLLTGESILIYNILSKKAPVFMTIFAGIWVFIFIIILIALKLVFLKIFELTKETNG